jgi:membrane-bound lytic murein transglycosylase A
LPLILKAIKNMLLSFLGILFTAAFILSGCQTTPTAPSGLDLTPVAYHDLPGWEKDQVVKALPALRRSCKALLGKDGAYPMLTRGDGGGVASDWQPFCTKIAQNLAISEHSFRQLLQTYLTPYQASYAGTTTGLFTGYDEPLLRGSRRRHGIYQTPLYRMPKGARYQGIPRNKIVAGALKGRSLELVWVDDPVGAFFLQIQGSGRIQLETGEMMRVGYAGQNGCAYLPIAKPLIQRGAFTVAQASRQAIRTWLRAHPRQAESIMSLNQSYVFFREIKGEGPIGAHGVALTPRRSLAVDRNYMSLGTPIWIDLDHPDQKAQRLRSLVVAQDIGGAIKGGVRGDLFWGYGTEADDLAGRMKSRGSYYLLLPK